MKKESFYLESNSDGLKLFVTTIIPKNKPKGIVQFCHGMAEHQTYYYDFMKYLSNQGYICVINDHRGHGKSVKSKDDYGYFYEETGKYVVEDVYQITKYMKKKYPKLPVYLFGHSMGSLIVRSYLKNHDQELTKLIVCGSPSKNPMTGPGVLLVKLVKLFKGEYYRSKFLNSLALTNEASEKWLSNNKEYIKQYDNDPKTAFIFTTNGFLNLLRLVQAVYSKKGWQVKKKNLPIFFIAGSDDQIIKSTKKYRKSMEFLADRGYQNIQYEIYGGLKHAIFMDDKERIYEDVLDFIEE